MYTAQQAQQRVVNTPELYPYYDILCEYDWPNAQDHIDWICTATVKEILDWCKTISD